jgi:hypothetical protein
MSDRQPRHSVMVSNTVYYYLLKLPHARHNKHANTRRQDVVIPVNTRHYESGWAYSCAVSKQASIDRGNVLCVRGQRLAWCDWLAGWLAACLHGKHRAISEPERDRNNSSHGLSWMAFTVILNYQLLEKYIDTSYACLPSKHNSKKDKLYLLGIYLWNWFISLGDYFAVSSIMRQIKAIIPITKSIQHF